MTPLVGRGMFQLAVSLAGLMEGTREKFRGAEGAAVITRQKISSEVFLITSFMLSKKLILAEKFFLILNAK